jgi:hypothetical protein
MRYPKKIITKKLLMKFCDENDIFYPKKASLKFLKASIYRFISNGSKSSAKNCFGFWEDGNSECSFCKFEDKCFKFSIGEDRIIYEKALKRVAKKEDEWF